jgi:hypothetical protein
MENVIKSLNRHPFSYLFNKPDLTFKETRIFLGISKVYLRQLIKNRSVPYHNRFHQHRIFRKAELIIWINRIGSFPEKEMEREAAWKLRRVHVKNIHH